MSEILASTSGSFVSSADLVTTWKEITKKSRDLLKFNDIIKFQKWKCKHCVDLQQQMSQKSMNSLYLSS